MRLWWVELQLNEILVTGNHDAKNCSRSPNSPTVQGLTGEDSLHIFDAHETQKGLVGSTSSLRLSISSSQTAQ